MRLHTDKITRHDLTMAMEGVSGDIYLEASGYGSRKRSHAFEVALSADEGKDRLGNTRRPRNSGVYGAEYGMRAATWYEWGDFLAALFKIDPRAIVGPYDGIENYVAQTAEFNPDRSGVSPWASLASLSSR